MLIWLLNIASPFCLHSYHCKFGPQRSVSHILASWLVFLLPVAFRIYKDLLPLGVCTHHMVSVILCFGCSSCFCILPLQLGYDWLTIFVSSIAWQSFLYISKHSRICLIHSIYPFLILYQSIKLVLEFKEISGCGLYLVVVNLFCFFGNRTGPNQSQ